ncbi:hypothetical protein OAQ84_00215 [Bdellovibrionales bacterium]|nr:hypothetical protein [Bdellovibrionales bacterium]
MSLFALSAGAVTENLNLNYELTVAGKMIKSSPIEMPFGEEKIVEFAPQKIEMNERVELVNYVKFHAVEGHSADNSKILLQLELGYKGANKSKVWMTPQIVTTNKKQAELSIGGEKEIIHLKVSPAVQR